MKTPIVTKNLKRYRYSETPIEKFEERLFQALISTKKIRNSETTDYKYLFYKQNSLIQLRSDRPDNEFSKINEDMEKEITKLFWNFSRELM